MKTPKELHEEAMSFYEESIAANFKGDKENREHLLREAYRLEKEAALLLKDRYELEPTRSKLFASCATMAYQLEEYRESEQMVSHGLTGNPPSEILEEFRDLFDKVNFYRHLTTKGIRLSSNEFRFTLGSGNEVTKGLARGDEVNKRIAGVESLYTRTVQRLNRKPFKTGGRPSDEESNIIQLYYKTPEAASFAIVFQIPESRQYSLLPELVGNSLVTPYIDEMIECIELINEGKYIELKQRINDDSYYESFVINARKIAPDGSNIKQVGFTIYRNNEEKVLPLSKTQDEINIEIPYSFEEENTIEEKKIQKERITIVGKLLISDSTKKMITVREEIPRIGKKGQAIKPKVINHRVTFVNEAQRELVRDYYEEKVSILVWKYEDEPILEFIDIKN